ncbi:MAG: glutamate--tRNA ligase family protein, partial [Sphingomicrobium sp.]
QRSAEYTAAFDQLRAQRLVYACFCTRSDIAAALSAPHGDAPAHYPGTCRDRPDNPDKRRAVAHSWRLDSGKALAFAGLPTWTEANDGAFASSREDFDDIIVARKDAPAAYHLACVVDDAANGVSMVVRGADLRPSTPVQRLLQILLRLPEPRYLHHQLVTHADGRRLAKRDLAPTLGALRAEGVDGPALAAQLRTGFIPGDFRFADA